MYARRLLAIVTVLMTAVTVTVLVARSRSRDASAAPASPVRANPGRTYDFAASPGSNYDTARFRLWIPEGLGEARGIVVLTPGSNEDGRPTVHDPAWQTFAIRNSLVLVGSRYTDQPHTDGSIERYVQVAEGSGQALESALSALASASGHDEVATAPLLLWGMSAGGQFNYEFVGWKPERVVAFVVNKGGVYYTALLPSAARTVPGLFFTGAEDLPFRTSTINGLFALNRHAGALWGLVPEPGVGHSVARSRDLAMMFFEDVLGLRLAGATLEEASGFIGDIETRSFDRARASRSSELSIWLPTERVARAWQAVVRGSPFDQ